MDTTKLENNSHYDMDDPFIQGLVGRCVEQIIVHADDERMYVNIYLDQGYCLQIEASAYKLAQL